MRHFHYFLRKVHSFVAAMSWTFLFRNSAEFSNLLKKELHHSLKKFISDWLMPTSQPLQLLTEEKNFRPLKLETLFLSVTPIMEFTELFVKV